MRKNEEKQNEETENTGRPPHARTHTHTHGLGIALPAVAHLLSDQ